MILKLLKSLLDMPVKVRLIMKDTTGIDKV